MSEPMSPQATRVPRAPQRRSRLRGFTLLEVVMAFSILAIGMTLSMRIATTAMRQAQQAADHTEAALHAQNLLDAAGLEEPLEPGQTAGEFDDTYRWTLVIEEYEGGAEGLPQGLDGLSMPVELLELELLIEWQRGGTDREARFRTLRAMLPNPLR